MSGYMGKVLDVDLGSNTVKTVPLSAEDARLYLGGKGLGARLLYDNTPAGVDPLGPDNVLILSTGPVTGSNAPQSNRFVVTTKSPLTDGIANSTSGGNFATKLKKSGFDAVIVRGKADKPVYIEITDGAVEIKDASHLWGKGTYATQEELPKKYGKAVIGPAGENMVRFAAIISEERAAGRCGTGAVMGSKNLKGIIADGTEKVTAAFEEKFKELRKETTKYLKDHPMTGDILPRLGTANLVMTTAGKNIIPTYNFKQGTHPEAVNISGEAMADGPLAKRGGCASCPIQCGRVVMLKGERIKGPEYETLGLLGTNIGNTNLENILEYNYICDDMGMDTISAGGVLGFAMELTEKGMLKSDLRFGKTENISQMLTDIAHRNGMGNELAEGVMRMSNRYGGHDFAIHSKGLELPAYDPRGCYGQGLEYATTNRGGCHICGSTMFLEATGPINLDPHSTLAKPALAILQQNMNAAASSMVMCWFASYGMIPPPAWGMNPHGAIYKAVTWTMLHSGPVLELVLKLKAPIQMNSFEKFTSVVTGRSVSMGEFVEIGNRVFNMERLYNMREGKTRHDDNLPPRLLNESIFEGIAGGVPLHKMLPSYYRIRGWDTGGRPTTRTLDRLRIRH